MRPRGAYYAAQLPLSYRLVRAIPGLFLKMWWTTGSFNAPFDDARTCRRPGRHRLARQRAWSCATPQPTCAKAVVPGAGHWLMEENPSFTVALIQDFLKDRLPARQPVRSNPASNRVTPAEFKFPDVPPSWYIGSFRHPTACLKGDPQPRRSHYTSMRGSPSHANCSHVHRTSCGTRDLGYLYHG